MEDFSASINKSSAKQAAQSRVAFNLEERISNFGEEVIRFCRSLQQNAITNPLINQIVRSATSIGANYSEANNGSSKRDFRNKAYIAKKEAQETKHWLKMFNAAVPDRSSELRHLWQECHELVLILQAILNKVDKK